jgi:hypothetical protein
VKEGQAANYQWPQGAFVDTLPFSLTETTRRKSDRISDQMLRVSGDQIVDENGTSILLRGAGLGGWMNQENFITGKSSGAPGSTDL